MSSGESAGPARQKDARRMRKGAKVTHAVNLIQKIEYAGHIILTNVFFEVTQYPLFICSKPLY